MAELEFELEKTFDENMQTFKKYLESIDPILTEILFKHIDKIKVTDNQAKDRIGRTEFNKSIVALSTIVDYLEGKIGKKKSSAPIYFTIKTAALDVSVDEVIAYVDSLGIKDPMKYARTIAKTIMDALSGK